MPLGIDGKPPPTASRTGTAKVRAYVRSAPPTNVGKSIPLKTILAPNSGPK